MNKTVRNNKWEYRNVHLWVEYHLGKASKCENDLSHKTTRYHWANLSGEYKRDFSDWAELCPRCHMIIDGVHTGREKCKNGHRYSEQGRKYNGWNVCRTCKANRQRERRAMT